MMMRFSLSSLGVLLIGTLSASFDASVASAQFSARVRQPYKESVVVERDAVVIALSQKPTPWGTQPTLPGYFAWRLDASNVSSFSFALVADTMMRANDLTQIVQGSSLRRCQDPSVISSHACAIPMTDSLGVKDAFVQMVVRDSATVRFFLEQRPGFVVVTTFLPEGRYRVERHRVRYRVAGG
jgi:hypothetical protein